MVNPTDLGSDLLWHRHALGSSPQWRFGCRLGKQWWKQEAVNLKNAHPGLVELRKLWGPTYHRRFGYAGKKHWTQPKSILWKSSFENHHPRIIPRLLRVTKPGSSINNHILRIITKVTIPRIIYCELSAENHHWESSTKNHQLRVTIPRIIHRESSTKIHHIENHLFQSAGKHTHLSNPQTSDLLGIIIESHQTQDHPSRFIFQESSIESHQTKIINQLTSFKNHQPRIIYQPSRITKTRIINWQYHIGNHYESHQPRIIYRKSSIKNHQSRVTKPKMINQESLWLMCLSSNSLPRRVGLAPCNVPYWRFQRSWSARNVTVEGVRRIEGKKYGDIDSVRAMPLTIIVSIPRPSYRALYHCPNYPTLFRVIPYQRTQCSRSARRGVAAWPAYSW